MHGVCGMRVPGPDRANTGRQEMWHVADDIVLARPCHAAGTVRMARPVCCPGTLLRMPELRHCLFQRAREYLVWPLLRIGHLLVVRGQQGESERFSSPRLRRIRA